MLFIGDVHVYVSDFVAALRFWSDGLGLEVAEKEMTENSAYAQLDFPDGGSALRLFGPTGAWEQDERPPLGARPTIRFDIATTTFDQTLVRLLEHGGTQVDEIETYEGLRTVTVEDPDGNSFELFEILEEEAHDHDH
ncbi:MAG: VOC family protein [Phycisphaerae bacterium]|nr:VOC family protein [Phycisphaerae bacterium]